MELLDDLLRKALARIARQRRLPEATYRLQFHAGFPFRAAAALVPYLHDLGVTHCYASPYLKARPGSTHGYDITDHRQLNPEIGSAEDYATWVEALHEHGMGQILDTVPNHMGIVGNDNAWWNDVLENGPSSPYANHFDIGWQTSPRPGLHNKVLLPILGDSFGKVLESGQVQLRFADGAFTVHYFEHRFPVTPESYARVLGHRLEDLRQALPAEGPALHEYQSILTSVGHLPPYPETDPARVVERHREKEVVKRRLAELTERSAAVRAFIERNLALFNGAPGDSHSFDLLDALLGDQPYRLSFWRVASDEINYRRFFDVNELAALSMEREEVFLATHELVLRLLRKGKVDGLRIDHPDGLYDPRQYLERLQQHYVLACARAVFEADPGYQGLDWDSLEDMLLEEIGKALRKPQAADGLHPWPPLYVVVEKILGPVEALPEDWPTYGTSGYDFLNALNGLFVDGRNAQAFTRLYRDWIDSEALFPEVVYDKKFLILQVALASELHMLAYQLDRLAQEHRGARDFTLHGLRHALRAVIACFPVYRSYISAEGIHEADRRYVQVAVRRARMKNPAISSALFDFVRDMLLAQYPGVVAEEEVAEQRRFAGKFQQVTSPVMAKGVEDTAFYVYNRLLSLNEVGGAADRFGVEPAALHRTFQERQARWPRALSATSTHDTKRSEDVRARLNVLAELPDEWRTCLARWSKLNAAHRTLLEDVPVPDANEEYFLYQTLLGAWPLEPTTPEEYAAFVRRIQAYMAKAMHEAKVHTSWINPDPAYDEAVSQFIVRVLDESVSGEFLRDFRPFQKRISHYGLFNALAQTLLKIAAPGVPDTYQGTEVWDFSLVDPDNRRPVDYDRRRRMLAELLERSKPGRDRKALARELLERKEDGRVKLYVTALALRCRRDHAGLFSTGEHLPLEATGSKQAHVFAFARRQGDRWAVAAVPRLPAQLAPETKAPLGGAVWQDTALRLPEGGPRQWRNVFTDEALTAAKRDGQLALAAGEVFGLFPVALLLAEQ